MIEVQQQAIIGCSPETWLEFVMDVEGYAVVDDKIGPITWVHRRDHFVAFKFRPKLPGLRLPSLRIVSHMHLTPGLRVDVELAPPPCNLSTGLLLRFQASFTCVPHHGGTRATRAISFAFAPGFRQVVEPVLSRTLPESVDRELRLAKQILELTPPTRLK